MKKPTSNNDGTTGAWNMFSEAVNKMGENEADNRRNKYLKKKSSLLDKMKPKKK